jgi:hypothetical protein
MIGAGASAAASATTSAAAGDHIVLGLEAQGLEQTAAQVGGRTLMSDPNWQTTLQRAMTDSSTNLPLD